MLVRSCVNRDRVICLSFVHIDEGLYVCFFLCNPKFHSRLEARPPSLSCYLLSACSIVPLAVMSFIIVLISTGNTHFKPKSPYLIRFLKPQLAEPENPSSR
jgi:hypothetical protein